MFFYTEAYSDARWLGIELATGSTYQTRREHDLGDSSSMTDDGYGPVAGPPTATAVRLLTVLPPPHARRAGCVPRRMPNAGMLQLAPHHSKASWAQTKPDDCHSRHDEGTSVSSSCVILTSQYDSVRPLAF